MSGMRDRLQRIERGIEDPRVDVLELVNWVYSEQRAHQAESRGLVRLGYGAVSADGIARIAELNALGCRVDVSTPDSGELHPVAETIHHLVVQEIKSIQSPAWLIPHYGAHAAVPPGYDFDAMLEPVWKNGPRWQVVDGDKTVPMAGAFRVVHDGSNAKVPLFCPLELSHGPDYQAGLMREYEHWHLALRRLARACAGCAALGRLQVTGPQIAREPWLDRGAAELARSTPEPSRRAERNPTRAPVQSRLLAILRAAARGDVLLTNEGRWVDDGDTGMLLVGEAMVHRLVRQGLASYVFDSAGNITALDVTARGQGALQSGQLVA